MKCDITNPNFTYSYCPSYGAAVLFTVLFSLPTVAHVYQAIIYRKPFAAILVMGGCWEVLGYIFRTISVQHPSSNGLNTAQMLLVLLAPLWINAFMYMLVGRLIHFYLKDDRIFGVKACKITLIFVLFDITAFLVQGTGGSMSSSTSMTTALTGLHVYTAGVALQVVFNAIFLAIVVKFHLMTLSIATWIGGRGLTASSVNTNWNSTVGRHDKTPRSCVRMLYQVYAVIGLILFRNFYRLAEFASGLNSTIIRHEWYGYVFDAIPMLSAMIVINVFYPGRKLQGDRCDFSEENRIRKQAKRDRKAARKEAHGIAYEANRDSIKLPNVLTQEVSGSHTV